MVEIQDEAQNMPSDQPQDEIRLFVVGPIQTNCYAYVSCGECLVVDPGANGAEIAKGLSDVSVAQIVATHGHHDHVCGVKALAETTGATFAVSASDAWRVTQALELSSHAFGRASAGEANAPEPDILLKEGDALSVGTARFRVMETPGHTEGGIVLIGEGSAEGIAFVGDTLFPGSHGRTDLLGGDEPTILKSLARMAAEIPAETALLCGHGPTTTMERELAYNPFLR